MRFHVLEGFGPTIVFAAGEVKAARPEASLPAGGDAEKMLLRRCTSAAWRAAFVAIAVASLALSGCGKRARTTESASPLEWEGAPVDVLLRLPAPAAADSDSVVTTAGNASLECGPDAVIYLAWTASAGDSTDILLARSADLGARFTETARVNDRPGKVAVAGSGQTAPRIALDRQGMIHALWTDRRSGGDAPRDLDVYCSRSDDGGASFLPSVRVDDGPDSTAQACAAMCIDEAGAMWAAWLDSRDGTPEDPNRAHVRLTHSLDGARSFLPSVDVTAALAHGVCPGCRPAVAVHEYDVLLLFRNDVENVRDIAFARSRDRGATFDTTRSIADEGWRTEVCPSDGPAVLMLRDRRWAAAWSTGAGGARAVKFFAASLDDSLLPAPVTLAPAAPGADQMHPTLFARDSLVVVCWEESVGGTTGLALALSKDGGSTFSPSEAFAVPAISVSRGPSVALAGWRHLLFAWSVGEARGGVRLMRALLEGGAPARSRPS
jgi:hypothetical protein